MHFRAGRFFLLFAAVVALTPLALQAAPAGGAMPAVWSVIPFVLLLLAIAVLPIVTPHWWHNNWNKLILALGLGVPVAIYLLFIGQGGRLMHQLILDYIPFITLLGALYYISGGIVMRGDIEATPVNNTMFLIVGSVLASFIGTTGASMLLIRPLLRTNADRKHVMHTVLFFIFCVSNIGGALTPLGDPPLFLGYLKGVPFTWTFKLTPHWLFTLCTLLLIYLMWDLWAWRREDPAARRRDLREQRPISMSGSRNWLFLLGVILTVAFVNEQYEPFRSLIKSNEYWKLIQVPFMLGMIALSKFFTPIELREENRFNLHPIQEVAFLFVGIFATMIPAVVLLEARGSELGITSPIQYFFATGIFSSFLDNAPTYLVFLALAQGKNSVMHVVQNMEIILIAISTGAVFMGANSYIGNAPNFMVKAIAEEQGVDMPSFGKYIVYSALILVPVFFLMCLIFLI